MQRKHLPVDKDHGSQVNGMKNSKKYNHTGKTNATESKKAAGRAVDPQNYWTLL